MLRRLVPSHLGLIPVAIAVSATALMMGMGLDTVHPPVLAQASLRFDEGEEIERFVRENVATGGSVGPPVVASGGDGQLTYSLSGTDAASFSVVPDTGQILVGQGTSLDFESDKTEYSLVVTASGQSGHTASVDVTVVVEDVNEGPEFDIASIYFEVKENTPANTNIGDPIIAADPEDDDVAYSLTGADAVLFAVDASSGQVKTREPLNFEAKSAYSVLFTASDPDGSRNSASIDLTVAVTDVDTEAPGAPEKPSLSPDPDDGHEALDVKWAAPQNAGPPVTSYVVQYRAEGSDEDWKQVIEDGSKVATTIADLESDTEYEAQVRAVNDEGEGKWSPSGKGSTFAVQPVNTPPEFDENAAATLSVAENSPPGTTLGGPFTASDSDPQDDLEYLLAGADSSLFSVDVASGQVSIGPGTALDYESPADFGGDNVYELTVQVTDGSDERGAPDSSVDDSIDVTIRVTDVNEPPVFSTPAIELEVDENSGASLLPLAATDPEGRSISWSLDPASPDGGSFSLSGTGSLAFNSAPDYESPSDTDRNNYYELFVIATDDGQPPASSRVSLTVRVLNIDEPGTVSLSTRGPQVGVEIRAELVDPDGGVNGASWQWHRFSGSQERAIAGATDSSYSPTTADDGSRLQATVSYVDRQGSGKYAVGPITHPVGDGSNSPPTFDATGAVTRQVAENTSPDINVGDPVTATDPDQDDLTYSLSGAYADAFGIDSTNGQIKTKDPLDHERQPEFRFTLIASDPGGLAVSTEITITVTDVDTEAPGRPDAPSVKPNRVDPINSIDIEWNAPPNSGPEISSYAVQYRVKDSGEEWTMPPINGIGAETTISGLEPNTAYEAQVHAANAEGTGMWSESGLGSTLKSLPANTAPEFGKTATVTLSVNENVPAGSLIGDPITATDLDNDELAYSLAGADSGMFSVEASTGQISTAGSAEFDHENPTDSDGDNVYELMLQVADGVDGNGSDDDTIDDVVSVAVLVTNVNEPPEFLSMTVELEIDENSPANSNIGDPIVAKDPESDKLTYSLGGADTDSFEIDAATGQIMVVETLDYEARNVVELKVIAADDGNLSAEIAVIIRVGNVNETPVVETVIQDRTVVESDGVDQFDVSAYFSDPDGDALIFTASSSDSDVARVGLVGVTLAITPVGIGTATVEVTATDPDGLRIDQSFVVNVVVEGGDSGGSGPFFPLPPQESGDSSDEGIDHANLLSETPVIVVPHSISLAPGESVILRTIAFNFLGDPLPASAVGVVCTWSSDGGGSFTPNGTEAACSTTFTAPDEGSGTITVRVAQERIAATGTGMFEVAADQDTAPGVVEEEIPEIPFPPGVIGSIVSRIEGVLIISPNGFTMDVPPGAIHEDYLGAYIEELSPSDVVVPEGSVIAVGSHAGNFMFTDLEGDPLPGFRTNAPVRICLPITQKDLDMAAGGIVGVNVVHRAPDGQFIHHLANNDTANMKTCADVDRFSLYFVGLKIEPLTSTVVPLPTPTETVSLTPTQSPELASSPTPVLTPSPTPVLTPSPTPVLTPSPTPVPSPVIPPEVTPDQSPTVGPIPLSTPVLPHTGGASPRPHLLFIIAFAAATTLTIGLALRRLYRQRL